MSGFKETLKGGWHPKGKDGKSKESWRGDFKGVNQVAGWMGKKKSATDQANEHVSRPLHQLKDPAAFGPPPKNVNYHGGIALPNQITPDRSGLGAPIPRAEIEAKQRVEEEEEERAAEEAAKPKAPPIPYRADRTGLSTANLPPPPGHKDRRPIEADKSKPPGLPPRLPPRQNSSPAPHAPSHSPTYGSAVTEPDADRGVLNQGALSRLGAAGVSVPGLGIGGARSKAPLPPPGISPARSPAPVVSASSVNSAQLGELQSRFSRMSASSSPKPDAPSEGTTFAQKQAALKTASAFRDDPSSVSLSDAKVAASTANNFRERHGEQVKTGWQSANKLNTKYGIADKVGSYGGAAATHSPEVTSPQFEATNSTAPPPVVGLIGKKKPPPPPPMKRAGLSQASLPPPIPLSSKPKPQPINSPPLLNQGPPPTTSGITSRPALPRDIDLALTTLWFTKSPIQLPPAVLSRLGKTSHASTSGWSSSGPRKTHTYVVHIRYNETLASTKVRLTWDASNPAVTVKAEQKHFPPPRVLGKEELEDFRERYNEDLANWCEAQMGTKVGNGECWTLANDGLKAVAAAHSARGQMPCMSSQSYVHGSLIYSFTPSITPSPSPPGGILTAGVARGDVVQFLSAHFKSGHTEMWAGMPDHTSVIIEVKSDGTLGVLEQNSGGVKIVKRGAYDMGTLVEGEVRIFRPVASEWAGELDPTW